MNKSELVKVLFMGALLFSVGLSLAFQTLAAGFIFFGGVTLIYALVKLILGYLDGELQ